MRYSVAVGAFLVIVGSWSVAAPKQGVTLGFEGNLVTASGVTPGAAVAWFSVAREPQPFQAAIVRREAIAVDTSGSGRVTFDVGKAVPPCSIWVAVDLKSGGFAVAAPPSEPLREASLSAGAFRDAASGKLARFVQATHLLQVFVARPGTGAWVATLTDQEDQASPTYGSVTVALEGLQPVGTTTSAPNEFLAGDVFVAIDPERMTVAAVRPVGPRN